MLDKDKRFYRLTVVRAGADSELRAAGPPAKRKVTYSSSRQPCTVV